MRNPFSAFRNWQERRDVLRDLRRMTADEKEVTRFKVRDALNEALMALELNDLDKATRIWQGLLDRSASEAMKSPLALQLLIKLRRLDEAETIMQQGRRKYPAAAEFAVGLTEISLARGDYEESLKRSADVRKRFPGAADGYFMGAHALVRLNRLQEAEALAKQATNLFPQEIRGFLEHARIASRREDWEEALSRWTTIREGFNDRPFGYIGRADAMMRLKRFGEAEAELVAASIRFPTSSEPYDELARCAELRGDAVKAVRCWKNRIDRFPMELPGYCEAALAFERLGEFVEADAALLAAIDRFRTERRPLTARADLLRRHGNPLGEAEVWSMMRQLFPKDEEAFLRGADALRAAGQLEQADLLIAEFNSRHRPA